MENPKRPPENTSPNGDFHVNQLLKFRLPVQRMSTVFTQPDQYLLDPINSQFDAANIPTRNLTKLYDMFEVAKDKPCASDRPLTVTLY